MKPQPPIPADLWGQIPPAAQAAILALVQQYEQRLQTLHQQVDQLNQRLNQNSTNSSRPPSSDPPHVKRRPPMPPTGRKRGGQPGHARQQRPLVPSEQVQQAIPVKPTACRKCGHALVGDDLQARRHQVAEIPPITPEVTEYRLHRLTCPDCGTRTCASLPARVPPGAFGPRLQALLAVLAGGYRLGKRPIRQLAQDLFGLSISTGMVANLERSTAEALQQPVAELEEYVRTQHANVDETSWREAGQKGVAVGRRNAPGNALPHCGHPLREGRRATARFGVSTGGHVGSVEGVHSIPPLPVLLVTPVSGFSGDDRPP